MLAKGHGSEHVVPKKLKKIYHLSGGVRDLQLQILRYKTTSKNEEIVHYLQLLEEKLDILKQKLSKLFSRKSLDRSKRKSLGATWGKLRREDYKRYSKAREKSIRKIASHTSYTDTQLHSIRKQIKDLCSNGKFFKIAPAKSPDIWKYRCRFTKKIARDLGNFQDLCNAVRLLQPASYPALNRAEKSWLEDELKTSRAQKKSIKKALIKALKKTHAKGTVPSE